MEFFIEKVNYMTRVLQSKIPLYIRCFVDLKVERATICCYALSTSFVVDNTNVDTLLTMIESIAKKWRDMYDNEIKEQLEENAKDNGKR